MENLTAIIPTLNEEENIKRALDSVAFADEVIVIDSYSTDNTITIIKENYPDVKILQRKFDDFSTQKNYAINKASNDWVFLLDADEEVSQELKEEVIKTLDKKTNDFKAFSIKRDFFFKDERVYFSGYRNGTVIRLFNKNNVHYSGKVHEKIIVSNNKTGVLKQRIKHYSYKSYNQYKLKLTSYAKLQAKELYERNFKPNVFHLYAKPVIRFLTHLIIKLGFLDGKKGYLLSKLNAYAVRKRYLELQKIINN